MEKEPKLCVEVRCDFSLGSRGVVSLYQSLVVLYLMCFKMSDGQRAAVEAKDNKVFCR